MQLLPQAFQLLLFLDTFDAPSCQSYSHPGSVLLIPPIAISACCSHVPTAAPEFTSLHDDRLQTNHVTIIQHSNKAAILKFMQYNLMPERIPKPFPS